VLLMLVYYGIFGLIADVALTVNVVFILGIMSMLSSTLTLPGIAGIVLTIGTAVDSNVLIYERIREEVRGGRTPLSAINSGFDEALRTIIDANVLIFERIREELMHGKTVRLAIDEGFKHAMNAIIDSNVSAVLTALFLFQFGTGPVKGFAVTLIMGIIASMITAIFVTRTFFMIWLDRRPAMSTLSI